MEEKKPMEIAEYNATEAGLNALKEKLKDVTYEIETTSGMALAKLNRRELITLRTNLEMLRKELKKPALERAKFIDTKAKQLEAEIRSLEEPIHKQIKDEETKVALAKQAKENEAKEKLRLIMERIEKLRALPAVLEGRTSLKIAEAIVNIESVVIDAAAFGDQIMLAQEAYDVTHQLLTDAFNEAVVTEKEAAQVEENRLADIEADRIRREEEQRVIDEKQKKLDDDRKEFEDQQKETNRINDIKSLISVRYNRFQHGMNLSADELRTAIADLKENVCNADEFAEFMRDADCAREDLYRAYEKILVDVEAKEAEELRVKTEQDAADKKQREEEDAEKQRLADKAIEDEKDRKKLEKEKKASDRKARVAEAKCTSATEAFQKIIELIDAKTPTPEEKLDEIQVIAEANI